MNSTENWDRVKEIFSSAIELDPAERKSFVESRCGDDHELRGEVASWLDSFDESDDFLETPVLSQSEILSNGSPSIGRRFGNYKIIREIGYGGMGAVFLAERTDGEFEHLVALKIVRQSIAESHMIERFRRERQILASLNHPNIAKLLDGGVSENKEPFIVMEYIEGVSINEFANDHSLNIDEKIRLFLKVCSAVAYAHRNLIVHRDLKPGNILVTSQGEPKLLDFGLAKLIDEDLATDTVRTQTAFRALTPAYASPELLRNDPITTASDIYSLGIVLYELLTGKRPFQLDGKSLDEIVKTVTELDPPLPSSNLLPSIGTTQLKGDLDSIILMSLRKEPERRYQSAEAFADDLERYLTGLPVSARPNTYKYRSGKFLNRHKVGTFATALILAVLIGGVIASLWQMRIAQHEKEKANSINTFLEQTLKYSNPVLNPLKKSGQETTVNEVLNEAAKRLESGEFDNDPELKMELERMIAVTLFSQSNYVRARQHMAEYVALLRSNYGENDPKYIIGMVSNAGLLFEKGNFAEAEATFRQFLPALRAEYANGNVKPEVMAGVLNNFAFLRRTQGDSHEAETLFRETLTVMPSLPEDERNSVGFTRSTLASTIADQGRFDEALATSREAVEEFRSRGETESPNYGFALTILGGFLTENGNLAEAESSLLTANTIYRRLMGSTSLWMADNIRNQSVLLLSQGKFEDALSKAETAAHMYEDNFGKHYDHYPTTLIVRGLALTNLGRAKEGEALLTEAVNLRTASLPPDHFWVAAANGALGKCLAAQRRFGEAEPLLEQSFLSLKASQERSSPRFEIARTRLINLYRSTGRMDLVEKYNSE